MSDLDKAFAYEYQKLVRALISVTRTLEYLGANDMGLLNYRTAKRFHDATAQIRKLTEDLTQDVLWPHEPGIPEE